MSDIPHLTRSQSRFAAKEALLADPPALAIQSVAPLEPVSLESVSLESGSATGGEGILKVRSPITLIPPPPH